MCGIIRYWHLNFKLNLLLDIGSAIIERLDHMAATEQDEIAELNAISTQQAEITQGIVDLEAAIQNQGNVSPEVQTALDNLKAASQKAKDTLPAPPTAQPAAGVQNAANVTPSADNSPQMGGSDNTK